jgi:flagellar motor switch protein FliG
MSEASARQSVARTLRGPDKVAALLLAMGKQAAGRLLKHFDEDELKIIATSAAKLGMVPSPMLEDIVDEFSQRCQMGSNLEGSALEIEKLLSGVIPADKLLEIMSQVRGQSHQAVWPKLSASAPPAIAQYLSKEHPQTAAYVMAKASPACAASVTAVMPSDLREEVMRRMVSIANVTPTALRLLETTLNDELLVAAQRDSGPDIHARMADILNKMEREHMDGVLQSLLQHRPKEAKVVKGLLFTFDDISRISQEARLKLFDQVPPERLIIALKNCEPGLKELILGAVAGRSRRMIEAELQTGVPSPPKDIVKTRRAIADLALEMAERGELEIHSRDE